MEVQAETSSTGTAEIYDFGVSTVCFKGGQHGVIWLCKCLTLWFETSDIAWRQVRLSLFVNNTELMTILGSVPKATTVSMAAEKSSESTV